MSRRPKNLPDIGLIDILIFLFSFLFFQLFLIINSLVVFSIPIGFSLIILICFFIILGILVIFISQTGKEIYEFVEQKQIYVLLLSILSFLLGISSIYFLKISIIFIKNSIYGLNSTILVGIFLLFSGLMLIYDAFSILKLFYVFFVFLNIIVFFIFLGKQQDFNLNLDFSFNFQIFPIFTILLFELTEYMIFFSIGMAKYRTSFLSLLNNKSLSQRHANEFVKTNKNKKLWERYKKNISLASFIAFFVFLFVLVLFLWFYNSLFSVDLNQQKIVQNVKISRFLFSFFLFNLGVLNIFLFTKIIGASSKFISKIINFKLTKLRFRGNVLYSFYSILVWSHILFSLLLYFLDIKIIFYINSFLSFFCFLFLIFLVSKQIYTKE